jgi:hypothetical protein
MKKIMLLSLALCLVFTMGAFAGDKNKEMKLHGWVTDPACAASGDKAKMADAACAKACAEKDGKLAFVNAEDGSVWAIENVDAVKGHEGHHVKISGHVNKDAKSVHIMNVGMMEDKAEKKEDKKSM